MISTRALYVRMIWWEDSQSAEEFSAELDSVGLNSWSYFSRENIITCCVENGGAVSYLVPGSAVFQIEGQYDAVVVVDPNEVELILAEEDAT